MDARLRWAGWAAVAAAAVFIGATAAGSILDPEYSQIRQHVSDLTATGAPTWMALVGPYVAYNLLVLAFAIGFYLASRRGWLWGTGLGLLTLNVVAGVGMATWFREDAGGVPTTFAGAAHVVLAGVSSLTIVLGSVVFGFAFRRSARWRQLAWFSFAVAVGFAILGPLAVLATAAKSDLAGLAERGPIGLFLVWLLVVGWSALAQGRRDSPSPARVAEAGSG